MVEVRTANQLEDLRKLFTLGGDVSIAVGYIDAFGLNVIKEHLTAHPVSNQQFRILVNLKEDAISPGVVDTLVQLMVEHGSRFQCREYFKDGQGILHAKLFVAHVDRKVLRFLTGSYNLTENALKLHHREHGVKVDCIDDEALANRVLADFDSLWNDDHCATALDQNRAELYRTNYRRNRRIRNSLIELEPPPRPQGQVKNWLFKCNVTKGYSFQDLLNEPEGFCRWNAVTDTPSLRYIREKVREGDGVLFYHSSTNPLQIMGTAMVVNGCYYGQPAHADPDSGFYDPEKPNEPWPTVDITANGEFIHPVLRTDMASNTLLRGMELFRLANQITVQPIRGPEWAEIIRLGMGENQP